jgi:hypothetical protein
MEFQQNILKNPSHCVGSRCSKDIVQEIASLATNRWTSPRTHPTWISTESLLEFFLSPLPSSFGQEELWPAWRVSSWLQDLSAEMQGIRLPRVSKGDPKEWSAGKTKRHLNNVISQVTEASWSSAKWDPRIQATYVLLVLRYIHIHQYDCTCLY